MKIIEEYEAMDVAEQENFIANASANLIRKLYYENNSKGLEVVVKNLGMLSSRARVCIECLGVLEREGNVYERIYLLLGYMSKNGIDEKFVSELEGITEYAKNILAQTKGASTPTEAERKRVMENLRIVLDESDKQVVSEAVMPEKKDETAMTNANPAKGKVASAEASISETAVAV